MKDVLRIVRVLALLIGICAGPALAAIDTTAADGLIDRLLKAPPATWDRTLSESRSLLGDEFITRIMTKCLEAATANNSDGARNYAILADYVDYYSGGKKQYRGFNQMNLGRMYVGQGNATVANQIVDTLEKNHPDAYAGPMLAGMICIQQKDFLKAVTAFKQAVALDQKNVECRMFLGAAYFYADKKAEARAEFEEVVKIDPGNQQAQKILAILAHEEKAYKSQVPDAIEHFNKAQGLYNDKKFKESIAEYQLAANADPKYARPYIFMGDAWFQLGEIDKSVMCYKKAIEIDPTDGQAWRYLGDLYEKIYDKTADVRYIDLAIDAYSKAVKADPTYTVAANDLQRAQEKRSRANPKAPPKPASAQHK